MEKFSELLECVKDLTDVILVLAKEDAKAYNIENDYPINFFKGETPKVEAVKEKLENISKIF